jgi:hypothetical protein
MRTLAGFAVAWATSVAVAFAAGCIYAVALMHGHAVGFLKAVGAGQKDALNIFLFVGGTTAIAAAAIALLVIFVIAWPLYLLSKKLQRVSRPQYIAAGLAIAAVVVAVLLSLQLAFSPLAVGSEYYLEIVTILVGGPAATLAFWSVVRPDRIR